MKKTLFIAFQFLCTIVAAQELSLTENSRNNIHTARPEPAESFIYIKQKLVYNLGEELKKVNESDIRRHMLGDEVAKRLFLIDKIYTYKSSPSPGSFSGRTIVEKPVIYSSLNKLEKQISRQVQNGQLTKETGTFMLTRYLSIALELFYEDTMNFEKALKKAVSANEMVDIFESVVFR
ncbi:MAG: hypothetical protein JW830_14660 [Bacteroidales bacterium]|nr:hypothetical protein [Bacteroidales bacterium]